MWSAPGSLQLILAFCALLLLTSCAEAPAMIRTMNAVELRGVQNDNLCFAYAFFLERGEDVSLVDNEIQRRNIDCSGEVERNVSDCSMLQIESWSSDSVHRNVKRYEVENTSDRARRFRVYHNQFVSSNFTIGPLETRAFAVAVQREVGMVGRIAGAFGSTGSPQPRLVDCVVP